MLHFITAIFPEADAVIRYFGLQKKKTAGLLTVYENTEKEVSLLLCGSGMLSAAMAVTEYLTAYPPAPDDLFCNLGIALGDTRTKTGDGFLCVAVHDFETKRCAVLEVYSHPFSEAVLYTSQVPVTGTDIFLSLQGYDKTSLPYLMDMEGYAVYAALSRHVASSRIFLYKTVSDHGEGTLSPQAVTAQISAALPSLTDFFKTELSLLTEESASKALLPSDGVFREEDFLPLPECLSDFPFTHAMRLEMNHLMTYARLSQIDVRDFLTNRAQAFASAFPGRRPLKKDSLLILNELKKYLIYQPVVGSAPTDLPFSKENMPSPLMLFHRIYVEYEVLECEVLTSIIRRFPDCNIVPIPHYKDAFNRHGQNLSRQESEPCFILAANRNTKFYPGAPVCQSFGEEHFLYTSCIMNCIYDCDYCYLQGMYPSGHIVVFVNLPDYFKELGSLLEKHPVYLCCSYDSDLLALGGLFPHAKEFCEYAAAHPNLRLELRTKCAPPLFFKKIPAAKNIVMAFTLSPTEIIEQYEHYTPGLTSRLAAAKEAARLGFSLRLCIDPILDVPNARVLYRQMISTIFTCLSPDEISDISVGTFRISKDYLKQLRTAKPSCALSHYPYTVTENICHYEAPRNRELLENVTEALILAGFPKEKIFLWEPLS